MKNVIRFGVMFLMTIGLANCSSMERTKWTDPVHRTFVDPDGLSANDYIRLVAALKENNRFIVVDRRDGIRAIMQEQEMIHKNKPDRFADREKYAIIGRLYSVGSVIIGRAQCVQKNKFLRGEVLHCLQSLAVIDAQTGEVISAAEGTNDDGEIYYGTRISSNWSDAVSKLMDGVPKYFEKEKYSKEMRDFREEAREEAIRAKEINALKKLESEE
jgi:hypothetical protein